MKPVPTFKGAAFFPIVIIALGAFIGLAAPGVAQASTYMYVDCGCDPTADCGNCTSCVCSEDYTLGIFATKEFRFRCTNAKADQSNSTYEIDNRHSGTTCTIPVYTSGYLSVSCTNWDLNNKDAITLKTYCSSL